ncbi:MAG TPA: non-canonical purine NTP pyrophosphatase, RdgB/HAM1 family [Cyanobacteria bacterium UBA8156]|jgi:XTP/dITP diphosphohydrolase|nr:non-canonical purine NTP pyrophosphatase, RdgB/HAM1 family [Cyanobacteria bacterium UBA8156]
MIPFRSQLAIASGNAGKIREFAEYLAEFNLVLLPKPPAVDVEETGTTFLENAQLKATAVAQAMGEWALADDSGLEVAALGGAPGVYSSRYGVTDADRIAKLLAALGDATDRRGRFVCALALADPSGRVVLAAEGHCDGEILLTPRGTNGFGYDPVFWVPDLGLTFAEMTSAQKAVIGHRGRALAIFLPQLRSLSGMLRDCT